MPTPLRLLARGSWSESQRFSEILRKETVGGMLLLAAAGTALVWANSPWSDTYHTVSEFAFGQGICARHFSTANTIFEDLEQRAVVGRPR